MSGRGPDSAVAAVVLGMHRSGTSAIARLLSLLGADLPRNLMSAKPTNETGHWEPQFVADLNDELLASGGSSWDDVGAFPPSWYGPTSEAGFRARAVEVLEAEYGSSSLFVLKDPRICRLTPFWLGALGDFGAQPCFVVMVRNPLEVANSLRVRDGFPIAQGLLMWLRHTLDAERDTRGHPRVVVSYERLLRDWESQGRLISEGLQLPWPKLNSGARAEVDRFLSADLPHTEFSADELVADRSVVEWVKTAFLVLDAACGSETTPDAEALDEARAALDRAEIAYGPLLAHRELEARARARSLAETEVLLAEREQQISQEREEPGLAPTDYEQANSALAEQLAIRIQEHEAMRVEVAERTEQIGLRDAELETLRAGHAEYEEAHKLITNALAASEAKLETLRTDHEKYKQAQEAIAEELAAKADQRETENERLRAELDRASSDLAAEAVGHRARIAELSSERDALAAENKVTARNLEESKDRLRARGAEGDSLRAELSARMAEAREAVDAREREIADLVAELRSKDSNYADLLSQGRLESERFAEAQAELASQTAELRAQRLFLREQDARLHVLEGQLAESTGRPTSQTRRMVARLGRLFGRGGK